jgi:hypothetical protein
MFLYHINHSFANQSIVSHQDGNLTVGDCLSDHQDNYYLVLGETIHRPHLYKIWQAPAQLLPAFISPDKGSYPKGGGVWKATIKDDALLSSPTLSLIHHLVYEYYTTYANIIKLYLPNDVTKLLKKQSSKPLDKGAVHRTGGLGVNSQTLIIMPDRWTIVNQQEQYWYALNQAIWSQHTINQDIKLFRSIKHGDKSNNGTKVNPWEGKSPWVGQIIVCTPGECFWDYYNLNQIILIDPHKRYYKSQQEPRYDIARVCELMAHYYNCTLTTNT